MDGFQHEQPDYWLNFGNPWEIERLNVGYPIKFYGHVSVSEDQGRQTFKWNPGESVSLTEDILSLISLHALLKSLANAGSLSCTSDNAFIKTRTADSQGDPQMIN